MMSKSKFNGILSSVGIVTIVLGIAVGGVTGTNAHEQRSPQVTANATQLDTGESGTVQINASQIPNGLSGFDFIVKLEKSDVATITQSNFSSSYGLTNTTELNNGSIQVQAVDLNKNFQPGDKDVPLVTLTVKGEQDGQTEIDVVDRNFDAEDGSPINVTVAAGAISVGDGAKTTTTTRTKSNEASTTTSSDNGQPGFGVVMGVIAIFSVAFLSFLRD